MSGNRRKVAVAVLFLCVGALLVVLAAKGSATDVRDTGPLEGEPTPDSCIGWWCTLSGVVYADAAGPGHELEGAAVQLSQFSYCSPTSGRHGTTTGPDGGFEFEIYLHDTDGFTIRVDLEGYEPASQSFGGFDCLFCACPPFEIVLKSSDTPLALDKTAAPDDGLRNNDTLTYTLMLSGPGLGVCLWDPLPAAVRYVSASITGSVTPPAVYSLTAKAVAWHGTLPTDTAQVIRFQVTPWGTGTGSLDLPPPIVNTAWLTDVESGRGVSATVIVNGRCVYLPLAMRDH